MRKELINGEKANKSERSIRKIKELIKTHKKLNRRREERLTRAKRFRNAKYRWEIGHT